MVAADEEMVRMEGAVERIELPIRGMSCASCASRIAKGLSTLPGVDGAEVNFATERATLLIDPGRVSLEELVRKVEDLGYEVGLEKVRLPIQGMSCAACVEKVEKALKEVRGVVHGEVNLALEEATIEYIPGEVTIEDLRRAVREAGYDVPEVEEGEDLLEREERTRREAYRRLKVKVAVGALLSIPIFIGSFPEWFPWAPSFLTLSAFTPSPDLFF